MQMTCFEVALNVGEGGFACLAGDVMSEDGESDTVHELGPAVEGEW